MLINNRESFMHVLFTEIEKDARSLSGQMKRSQKRRKKGV